MQYRHDITPEVSYLLAVLKLKTGVEWYYHEEEDEAERMHGFSTRNPTINPDKAVDVLEKAFENYNVRVSKDRDGFITLQSAVLSPTFKIGTEQQVYFQPPTPHPTVTNEEISKNQGSDLGPSPP
jgi:hypothetical protein